MMRTTDSCRLLGGCQKGLGVQPKLFYRQTFRPGFVMNLHRHITMEVMYAQVNPFLVNLVGRSGREESVRVRQGEFILLNSLVYHSLEIGENPIQILNLEFQFQPEGPLSVSLSELYRKSEAFRRFAEDDWDHIILSDDDTVYGLILRIQHLMLKTDGQKNDSDATNALLLQLLTMQFFLECASLYCSHSRSSASDLVNRAVQYIHQNLETDIHIADIARYVNLNPSYLEVIFKRQTGVTITWYINKQRIAKAITFLTSTDTSVTEIGYLVGYNNRQHFNRVFRQMVQMAPGEYRVRMKEVDIKNYTDDDRFVIDKYIQL